MAFSFRRKRMTTNVRDTSLYFFYMYICIYIYISIEIEEARVSNFSFKHNDFQRKNKQRVIYF